VVSKSVVSVAIWQAKKKGNLVMLLNHNGYLNYNLPQNWCAEYVDELLLIYNPDGNGAMTISFFNILDNGKSIDEQISICAKKFIDKNNVKLKGVLIITGSKDTKLVLQGSGTTLENDFIRIWVVANSQKLVFVSYESDKISDEVRFVIKLLAVWNLCKLL